MGKESIWSAVLMVMTAGSVGASVASDERYEPKGNTSTSMLTIDTTEAKEKSSPILYGLMTEEINYCYDGGLYAELIRNRNLKENNSKPLHWTLLDETSYVELDLETSLNEQHDRSMRWEIGSKTPTRLANEGWWGIPVYPNSTYKASFYAKCSEEFTGSIGAAIISKDGNTVYAHGQIKALDTEWKRYELELRTGDVAPTADAQFALVTAGDGTIWLNLVSLFPPTWNDRSNGLRKDLMQMLVDLKPKFLRFPGGNYLEGNRIDLRFKWWETLGKISERPGHPCPWGYLSSDGMGLHEFLLWAEDMGAEPVLGLYAGYSLKGDYIKAGKELDPFVEEALNEIEYVIGPVDSEWGAKRAAAGHPEPFPLHYVEIGNEDWFDKSDSYQGRYAQFHDAIKKKYPQLKCISSIGNEQSRMMVKSRKPDVLDEHYYKSTDEFLRDFGNYFENYDRNGPEIFVGEWAAHEDGNIRPWDKKAKKQHCTPSMTSAIGDAMFMAAMERNSDIVTMQAYAPLFVNVNEYQWRPDLIGYNAITSYGAPSYYALKMFSTNYGDEILDADFDKDSKLHCSVTRNSKEGLIYIKVINPELEKVQLRVALSGTDAIAPNALVETLTGEPDAINSIENPKNVVTESSVLKQIKPIFGYTLPAYSVIVITVKEL